MTASQSLFCTPNYLKSTFFAPVLGGGDWDSNNWLTNIQNKYFINKAISNDLTLDSTKFQVDLSVMRDIKAFIVTSSNVDNDGLIRVKATNTIAWSEVTVNGINAIGITSLNITAGLSAVTITAGDIFTITGDTTVYEVVTGTSLSPSTSGSITIKRSKNTGTGLVVATTGGEAITCNSGDYSAGEIRIDTGFLDYKKVIHGFTDPFGGSRIWLGKETAEERATLKLPNPYILLFDNIVLARYWCIEIDNTTNSDGFIEIEDAYLSSAFIPSTGVGFGAVQGLNINTTSEESAGGVEDFDIEKSGRFVDMTIPGLTVEESLVGMFDLQRRADIHDDFFWVLFDNRERIQTRSSFPARFTNIGGQQFVAYDWVDNKIRIKEKLA